MREKQLRKFYIKIGNEYEKYDAQYVLEINNKFRQIEELSLIAELHTAMLIC